jgi:hypothetical protein
MDSFRDAYCNSGMDHQRQTDIWKRIVAAYQARSHPEDIYMPVDELIRALWLFASTHEVLKLLEIAFTDGRIRCNPPHHKFAFTILELTYTRQ